jgi:hypothetical protein
MPGNEVTKYVDALTGYLPAGVVPAELNELIEAGQQLADALDTDPGDLAEDVWTEAEARWTAARDALAKYLAKALLGVLTDIPGVSELIADVGKLQREGVHGSLDVGPVHLEISSATLVLQPPKLTTNVIPKAIVVGPFRVGAVSATLVSPFGGGKGVPGGGSIVELPKTAEDDGGYGGTLLLPLGPVKVSASAILSSINKAPSFLAILGVTFTPPIQLSFGFSLDRVGGIVGVNRRADVEALRAGVRTGSAGDVLFSTAPPAKPAQLLGQANSLFPAQPGSHLIGPSMKLSWLSFGDAGSLLGLDLAVVIEIPTGRVVIVGVTRASIPSQPYLLNLRLDVLGVIDPVEKLVSIDASLVDSHVLGIFSVYGDAALRFSWGTRGYLVATVGGFYPGFNPEPARLPALRRVGLALSNPVSIISIRAEGYFAITSNTIQFGGRLEIGISLGIKASGFIQVDALVQFRPFHFEAQIGAGFRVSAGGFTFGSVNLHGTISGPGPIVIHGSLSIDVFLFSLSWNETFTLGSGPADALPTPEPLLTLMSVEFGKAANVAAAGIGDAQVLLKPRAGQPGVAAVPPTGALQVSQRRAPLGVLIDRVDGRPLSGPQQVTVDGFGPDVTDQFAPGGYATLSASEAMSRPPFDMLPAGRVLSPADPQLTDFPDKLDTRTVTQIVIKEHEQVASALGKTLLLNHIGDLVGAASRPPALSDAGPLVTALAAEWTTTGSGATYSSATAAHQAARYGDGVAVVAADASDPVDLAGVL